MNLNLESELTFIMELDLSRKGMIEEIKTEFNIIRLCLTQMNELGDEYLKMFDRILVMPLRKLLCEKSSVLLKVLPEFKMPPLSGAMIDLDNKLKIIRPALEIKPYDQWVLLSEWLERDIAYFDRTEFDLPDIFPDFIFQNILNKLKKKADKKEFESLYKKKIVNYKNKPSTVYTRLFPEDLRKNETIFNYLKQIGYNNLSVYNFIKHQSDKRGAHIDVGHSILVEMIDNPISKYITMTLCIAIQMIYASKIQIPDLADYWADMPELMVDN